MIIAHYHHRLPANYDINLIRSRARERGVLWDAVPDLYFKGFLLREKGKYGFSENNYSSLYLWRRDEAFRDFLLNGRFKIVTDSFGRAPIQGLVALDAAKGRGSEARFVYKEELDIAPNEDLTVAFAREVERTRAIAASVGTVAALIGVDTERWKLIRFWLSENEPGEKFQGLAYELLYLAQPLLGSLPEAQKP
jgi:hypothetical protein